MIHLDADYITPKAANRRNTTAADEAPGAAAALIAIYCLAISVGLQLVFRTNSLLARSLVVVGLIVGAVLVYLLFALLIEVVRRPVAIMGLATAATLACWFAFVGPYTWLRDAVTAAVALGVCIVVLKWYKRWKATKWSKVGNAVRHYALFWLVFWLGVTIADHLVEFHPLIDGAAAARAPLDSALVHRMDSTGRVTGGRHVTLALSGGGYRAALLHAGVVSGLEELGIRPTALSTVSGGSIFGAFYAGGGRPEGFLQAMLERRFNMKREFVHVGNVLHMIANTRLLWFDLNLLPSTEFTRTHVEADLLDRNFLRDVRHADYAKADTLLPELMVCATDIVGARALGITPRGTIVQDIDPVLTRFAFVPSNLPRSEPWALVGTEKGRGSGNSLPGDLRRSILVAASGAFPGAFKPLRVYLDQSDRGVATRDTLLLADGGLADNMGLVLALAARHEATHAGADTATARALGRWDSDVIISSDGSAVNGHEIPWNMGGEISKSIDLVYRTTSGEQLTRADPGVPVVPLTLYRILPAAFPPDFPNSRPAELVQITDDSTGLARQVPTLAALSFAQIERIFRDESLLDQSRLAGAVAALRRWESVPSDANARGHVMSALRDDIGLHMQVFLRTATLKDQYPERDARALYELGRYLVLLNTSNLIAHAAPTSSRETSYADSLPVHPGGRRLVAGRRAKKA